MIAYLNKYSNNSQPNVPKTRHNKVSSYAGIAGLTRAILVFNSAFKSQDTSVLILLLVLLSENKFFRFSHLGRWSQILKILSKNKLIIMSHFLLHNVSATHIRKFIVSMWITNLNSCLIKDFIADNKILIKFNIWYLYNNFNWIFIFKTFFFNVDKHLYCFISLYLFKYLHWFYGIIFLIVFSFEDLLIYKVYKIINFCIFF